MTSRFALPRSALSFVRQGPRAGPEAGRERDHQNRCMDLATPETPSRPWLAHYPDGVPRDIDPSQYRSLAALLEESLIPPHGGAS